MENFPVIGRAEVILVFVFFAALFGVAFGPTIVRAVRRLRARRGPGAE